MDSNQPQTIERPGLLEALPLRTARLTLRPFTPVDGDALYTLHRNPRVTRHAGGTRSKAESARSLERIITRTRASGFGALAVQENMGAREVIGWCGIQPIPDIGRYEIIYALRPDRWGNGLAVEAASVLIFAAFELRHLSIIEICALVYPQNVQSIKVIEKLGMTFERSIFDEPSKRHACVYSVFRPDFLKAFVKLHQGFSSSKK